MIEPGIGPAEEEPVEEKRSYKKVYLLIGIVLFLFLLFIIGFVPRFFQTRKINVAAAESQIPQVRTIQLKQNREPVPLVLPSSIQAFHITPIWARTNGYLIKLIADIGDVVKEGDLLSLIDTPDIDHEYSQSIADLASFQAKLDIAKIAADRWLNLYHHNPLALSKEEVDERVATYNSAKADVLAAEANMQRLKTLVDFKRIIAPFNGIIIQRDIDLGSLITQGSNSNPQQLYVIAKTDVLRIFVDVPQPFFRSIKEGVSADIRVQEFPDKTFKGTVTRYAKALDPTARTLRTEVDIENKSGELYPGLYAEVLFHFYPDTPLFIIPTEALIIRAGKPHVALLDNNNVAHLVPVKIGIDNGKTIEISDGLKENDILIANPTDRIREGTKVHVIH